ncbi:vacuolar membrane protein-domain-containing protein [Aspergillus pseudodeflectus]|uniref:Vacuolar membrane protein-domain-containing protein n=1 Tax=Aspergillus pseudodeflectus TaxID=176178 RepID=A0ABR4JN04_9EURO
MASPIRSLLAAAALFATLNVGVNASVPVTSAAIIPSPTASSLAAALYTPTDSDSSGDDEDTGECRLLGPFSILVQASLGMLALLSLVYKRWRERPQRPVKVWAFDASKQVFGSSMLHLLNLVMSMFSAGQFEITSQYKPNPCSFYLLNLGIDTTLGIPILIFILHLLNRLASYTPLANPLESIESGNYGDPPRWGWWFKQSVIYFMGLLGMKICVFFLIQTVPLIVKVGDWALRWTEGNTAVQIIFVMLLFPVIMNAIQYYIIDIFIKKPIAASHDLLEDESSGDDNDHDDRHALLAGMDNDESDDDTASKNGHEALRIPSQSKEVSNRFGSPDSNPVIVQEFASSGSGSTSNFGGPNEYDETNPSTIVNAQPKRP